MYYLLFL